MFVFWETKGHVDLKQVLEFDLEGGVCLRPLEWLHVAQGNYPAENEGGVEAGRVGPAGSLMFTLSWFQ